MSVVLVTGGTRGIGRAIVEALVAAGRTVAFTWASDEARARALEAGGRVHGFRLDLLDRARPDTLVPEVEEALGPVSGLVNNAGVRHEALLAMTGDAAWDRVIDADLGGAFRMCRAVVPGMVHRRAGSIVNVSSLSALHGVPGESAYAAAKLGLTRALAREVGRRGIRVNAVVPGFVPTDFTAGLAPERVATLRAGECLPGGVAAGGVAGAALWLLSDASAAVTGQTLVVDAGASA
jgi:3-oxoacyl-[acyl-carrier protein] reductase